VGCNSSPACKCVIGQSAPFHSSNYRPQSRVSLMVWSRNSYNLSTFGLAGAGSGVRQPCERAQFYNDFREQLVLTPDVARRLPFCITGAPPEGRLPGNGGGWRALELAARRTEPQFSGTANCHVQAQSADGSASAAGEPLASITRFTPVQQSVQLVSSLSYFSRDVYFRTSSTSGVKINIIEKYRNSSTIQMRLLLRLLLSLISTAISQLQRSCFRIRSASGRPKPPFLGGPQQFSADALSADYKYADGCYAFASLRATSYAACPMDRASASVLPAPLASAAASKPRTIARCL
jgi:hypothetical protein